LHVAAVVVGALLLLVTAGDLLTLSSPPRAQFAAPAALTETEPEAYPEQTQARALPVTVTAEPVMAAPAAPAESINAFERPRDAAIPAPAGEAADSFEFPDSDADFAAGGTAADENASQGLLAEEAPPAPQAMATAAVAAVTQAVPTPMAAPGPTSADESVFGAGQPSRLRMLQIGLAIALLWLVVSIVGLRRVRA
jgi:hypothetical protein